MTGTTLLITTIGGISLLLWGCRMARTAVMRAFGSELQLAIANFTDNRFAAICTGVGVGTALQSSTATALLISSFVGQGVIATTVALAIMLGADLGAAIAATIFASGVSSIWPLLAFAGYIVHTVYAQRSVLLKNVGRLMIGLGILFLGLKIISMSASDIAANPLVAQIIETTSKEPVIAILIGLAITWIAYSSIVVVLLAASLAISGSIDAAQLLPFLLGVNIGAALPALTATLSEPPLVRRIPVGNLLFRLMGVILVLPFLSKVPDFLALLSSDPSYQVIGFHLAFNLVLCCVFVWFVSPIAQLTEKLLPTDSSQPNPSVPRFLDERMLETPPAALGAATRETLRMGSLVEEMLQKSIEAFEDDSTGLSAEVDTLDDQVDQLNEAIKLYLTQLMRGELSEKESLWALDILIYTTNLEHVGDIVDKNLMQLAQKKQRLQVQFSKAGMQELRDMHERVMDTLQLSFNVFTAKDVASARQLISRKTELRTFELEGLESHVGRLTSGKTKSIVTSGIHIDVLRDFKRINSHLASVAYPVLERAGELRKTRLKKVKGKQSAFPKALEGK